MSARDNGIVASHSDTDYHTTGLIVESTESSISEPESREEISERNNFPTHAIMWWLFSSASIAWCVPPVGMEKSPKYHLTKAFEISSGEQQKAKPTDF